MKNETVHNFLAHEEIKWKFNLSRAPWWGKKFERLIGSTKKTMYKALEVACSPGTNLRKHYLILGYP